MKYAALSYLLLAIIVLVAPLTVVADTISGNVVDIADGDTITVLDANNQRHEIRLSGIDAPESGQGFGSAAKLNLSDLVLGEKVAVIWNKLDSNRRILGTVTVGSVDAGLEQIKAGFAWYFRRYESDLPEIKRRLYAAAEAEARTKRRGLWQQSNPVAPWEWQGQIESQTLDLPRHPATAPLPSDSSESGRSGTTRRSSSVQCSGTTKKGSRCLRMTLSSNGRCWQHGGN